MPRASLSIIKFPAMIAPVIGPDGALQSIYRTYLTDRLPKRERKKIMPAADTIRGGAVRLFEVVDRMGVAEGIETVDQALVLQRSGLRVWPGLSI